MRVLVTSVAVCGVVPVAATVPVLLDDAYRHSRGTTTVSLLILL